MTATTLSKQTTIPTIDEPSERDERAEYAMININKQAFHTLSYDYFIENTKKRQYWGQVKYTDILATHNNGYFTFY